MVRSIIADLGDLKVLVYVFKHGSRNIEMPRGNALVKESETRCGTSNSIQERFQKVNQDVQSKN